MRDLYLVRGIPGSGKSTLAQRLAALNRHVHQCSVVHYEADQYFMDAQGNYNFDATKLHQAHKWCQDKTREGLTANATVIVSNTFTTKKELKPYFDMAKEFGIVPVVYLAQNQFNNVHNVPEDKLQAMRDRFQYDISELFGDQE
jgi:predicted kinase